MTYPPATAVCARAFTLVEALIIVAVTAVLGSVVISNIQGTREASADAKLERDVATINSGVDAYLASGGSIPAGATAQNVINLLKTRADSASAGRTLGLTGSFIDPRTVILAQAPSRSNLRATWDAVNQRFATTRSGGEIPGFGLDEVVGGALPVTQARQRTLDQATGGGWVWNYADAAAPERPAAFVPGTVEGSDGSGLSGDPIVQLALPVFDPPGSLGGTILDFPREVHILNPNPAGSSRIYYSLNGGPSVLYTDGDALEVDPDGTISALAVSLDASRYRTSGVAVADYNVTPIPYALSLQAPGSVTYSQLGQLMELESLGLSNGFRIHLAPDAHPQYLTGAFEIFYTLDGSDPQTSASRLNPTGTSEPRVFAIPGITHATWGTNSAITIRAVAESLRPEWFADSTPINVPILADATPLPPPIVAPTNQIVTFSVTVTMTNPVATLFPGTTIRYTTNDTAPEVLNGFVYNSPFSLSSFGVHEDKILRAATVPTVDMANWFTTSPETVRIYTGPAFAGSGIPSGALVGSATLNSTFNGNVTIAVPTNGVVPNITYNQNAVINGSLYVPGTPRVAQNSPWIPQWTLANDHQFANRIYGDVEGQGPSPRVVDLTGPITPTNYVITFNNNSYITGKIFRRAEHYTLEPLNVSTFPPKTSSNSIGLNGPVSEPLSADNVANVTLNTSSVGSVALLPGTYGNMTANNNSKFVLGNPDDPETPVVYNFDSLALNSGGDVVIVGRVILNIRNGFNLSNGAVFGNEDNPDWLQVNVWNANVNVASGSSVYGRIFAPNNTVAFNNGSILNGSVSAKTLELNSTSVVFSLSPAISPGF
jgi:type II secretory pathway pseudopilin PulG